MAIEKVIEFEDGKELRFEFTNESVEKFSNIGGDTTQLIVNPIGNAKRFIVAFLQDEGSVSMSKAEKLLERIQVEFGVMEFLNAMMEKYNEVFTGGENAPPKRKI